MTDRVPEVLAVLQYFQHKEGLTLDVFRCWDCSTHVGGSLLVSEEVLGGTALLPEATHTLRTPETAGSAIGRRWPMTLANRAEPDTNAVSVHMWPLSVGVLRFAIALPLVWSMTFTVGRGGGSCDRPSTGGVGLAIAAFVSPPRPPTLVSDHRRRSSGEAVVTVLVSVVPGADDLHRRSWWWWWGWGVVPYLSARGTMAVS